MTLGTVPAGERMAIMPMKELYKVAPEEFIEAWYHFLEHQGQEPLVKLIDRVADERAFTQAEMVAVMIGISFMDWPTVPALTRASLNRPMGTATKTLFADYLGLRGMVEFEIRVTLILDFNDNARRRVRELLSRIFRAANTYN